MSAALGRRVLSAAFYVPIVLVLILLGPWSFAILLGAVAALAGLELYRILRRVGWEAPAFLPAAAPACLAASLANWFGPAQPVLAFVAWTLALLWLFRPRRPQQPRRGLGSFLVHLLGALYLGLFLAYLARLLPGPWDGAAPSAAGPHRVFYALFVVWGSDTGAFAVGLAFGRRPLWPAVSPKKTWEGAFGGFLVPVALGAVLALPLGGIHPLSGAVLGAAVGITAQLGDLIESRLKRMALVKDSGALIPGHGGLLDRLDSLLFSIPLFYYGLIGLAR